MTEGKLNVLPGSDRDIDPADIGSRCIAACELVRTRADDHVPVHFHRSGLCSVGKLRNCHVKRKNIVGLFFEGLRHREAEPVVCTGISGGNVKTLVPVDRNYICRRKIQIKRNKMRLTVFEIGCDKHAAVVCRAYRHAERECRKQDKCEGK